MDNATDFDPTTEKYLYALEMLGEERVYTYPRYYIGAAFFGTFTIASVWSEGGLIDRANWEAWMRYAADVPALFVTEAGLHGTTISTLRLDPEKATPEVVNEIAGMLDALEGYPVLDDDIMYEMEYEETWEMWDAPHVDLRDRVDMCREAGVSIFAARRADEIPEKVQTYLRDSIQF